MQSKRITAYVVLFVGLLLVFSSLITVAEAPDRATKEANSTTLVVTETTSPPTLSTFTAAWTTEALEDIVVKLVSRDTELNYRDGIAQSWEVSVDGLAWTFTLKPGVMFHDGTPCDAEAIAWNIETMRDTGASSYLYSAVQDAVAVDPVTLKLILKNPFPNLLYNVSNSFSGINSPTAVEKYGEDYGVIAVVGSGPYMFKEWVKGDHITLERNPDYTWGPSWMSNQGPAYFQTVIYRFVPEAVTKTMLLQAGEADIVSEVDPTAISALKADQNVTVGITSGKRLIYMGLNVTKPPFDDVLVRQAMNYIVDRESITENVFHGAGLPAYNYLTPNVQPQVESPYTYDPQKASTLLAAAGWTKNKDGILEKNGQQFAIILWTESITDRVQIATVLQSEMAEVGIKATIQQFDSGSYGDMFKTGEQQAFIRLYGWDNADIIEWFFNSKRIATGVNKTRTNNSLLDFLFVKAEAMPTPEERTFVYRLVHQYMLEQSAWVPIFYPAQVRAYRSDLGGYKATLDHVYLLDVYRK
ncbi:ABC transporter substrate-binding protein [archaeon]|nr:MAG: ABC transporter substrate-binding protein [archaeon]